MYDAVSSKTRLFQKNFNIDFFFSLNAVHWNSEMFLINIKKTFSIVCHTNEENLTSGV